MVRYKYAAEMNGISAVVGCTIGPFTRQIDAALRTDSTTWKAWEVIKDSWLDEEMSDQRNVEVLGERRKFPTGTREGGEVGRLEDSVERVVEVPPDAPQMPRKKDGGWRLDLLTLAHKENFCIKRTETLWEGTPASAEEWMKMGSTSRDAAYKSGENIRHSHEAKGMMDHIAQVGRKDQL